MLDTSFVTQSEYQKHIRGEWRTIHNLWPHIRTYVPGYGYSRAAIDAMFAGTQGSIAFADATGFIAEDNANLFWNATLKVLEVMAPTNNTYIGKGVIGAGNSTGTSNVFVGYEAGYSHTIATFSTFVGVYAGRHLTTATESTLVGYLAGYLITTSPQNTCIGANAGKSIQTGQGRSTCIGANAGGAMTTGYENVCVGMNTGGSVSTGYRNTFIGYDADATAAASVYRISIGYQADSTEDNLCAIGGVGAASVSIAIFNNREFRFYDNGNNYVGFKAPALATTQIWVLPTEDGDADDFLQTDGSGNLDWAAVVGTDEKVAVDNLAVADYLGAAFNDGVLRTVAPLTYADGGNFVTLGVDGTVLVDGDFASAGIMMTDGAGTYSILPAGVDAVTDHNLYMGAGAGASLAVGGQYHILIGESAGASLTTADRVICIGYQSGEYGDLEYENVYIGYRAGRGGGAGQGGSINVAIGASALQDVNAGNYNVAIGTFALQNLTSGSNNFGLGYNALGSITTHIRNVGIGSSTGLFYGHTSSVLIGYFAGARSNDAKLVAIGDEAGRGSNAGGCNFSECVYVGYYAGRGLNCTGVAIYNVAVGTYALQDITLGDNNTVIGHKAGEDITSGSGNVCIGYMAGSGQITVDSNELWIANSNTATPLIYGEFPNTLFRITATNINAIGITNLGDGGVTNYASFAIDGTLSLFGTSKVLKRIFLNNAAFTKGTTAPTQVILGFLNGWEFDIGDDAVMTSVVPDDWDTTTDLTIKVCWYIDEAYAADKEIQWRIDWSALPHDFSETVDAPTHTGNISSGDIDIPAVAKRMGTSTVGIIAAADLAAGDMLGFKLSRIAVTHDNPTAKPTAHHLMIEYTADKLGT